MFPTDSGARYQSNSHPTLFHKEEDLFILIDLETEKERRYCSFMILLSYVLQVIIVYGVPVDVFEIH